MMWGYSECRAISRLLWNYTAHRLSEEEIERVERHLASCGACRAEAEGYRQTVDALAGMRRQGVPESRRGWHEVRERLSAPERRSGLPIQLWSFPTLAWGAAALVAAIAFVLVRPAADNVPTVADAGSGTHRSAAGPASAQMPAPEIARGSQDSPNANEDEEDWSDLAGELESRGSTAAPGAARLKPAHRVTRHATQLALGAPASGRRRFASGLSRARIGRTPDFARIDGQSAANSNDNNDFVLTPVTAVSESDSSAHYVMGSVITSGRSSDTEVANRW